MAVIETDGTIEQADSIKVAYDGAPATGLDIFRNALSEAAGHPAIRARQLGLDGLSDDLPPLPGRRQLRRRALRAPVPDRERLRQSRRSTAPTWRRSSDTCRRGSSPRDPRGRGTRSRGRRADRGRGPATARGRLRRARGRVRRRRPVAQLISAQRIERRSCCNCSGCGRGAADELFLAGWALLVQLGKEQPRRRSTRCSRTRTCGPGPSTACGSAATRAALPADAAHLAAIAAAAAIRAGTPGRDDGAGQRTATSTCPRSAGCGSGRRRRPRSPSAAATSRCARRRASGTSTSTAPSPTRTGSRSGSCGPGEFAVRPGGHRPLPGLPPVAGRAAADRRGRGPLAGAVRGGLAADRIGVPGLRGRARGRACPRSCRCRPDQPGGTSAPPPGRPSARSGSPCPDDGETLALLLIHEFQHVKLGALLDLYELCDPDAAGRLFYAPVARRPAPDRGPAAGHLRAPGRDRLLARAAGIARDGPDAVAAAERFARWRALTAEAIETLAGSRRADRRAATAWSRGCAPPSSPGWTSRWTPAAAEAARQWAAGPPPRWEQRRQS